MKAQIWTLTAILSLGLFATAETTTPVPTVEPKAELIQTVVNDENENLVADGSGRTLYIFDIDNGTGGSQCNGTCAEVWPPYLISADEAAVLQAPLASVVRANKKIQLTYEGKPLYTYALDRHDADDQGDGIGGVWHYIELEDAGK